MRETVFSVWVGTPSTTWDSFYVVTKTFLDAVKTARAVMRKDREYYKGRSITSVQELGDSRTADK